MAEIQFIRNNPATEAFWRGQREHQQIATQDLANEAAIDRLLEQRASRDARLRSAEADAIQREAQAELSRQTVPYDVTVAQERAARAPLETQQTQAQTRLSQINAGKGEIDVFIQSLELAEQGDIEGAKRVAATVGDEVPDDILRNRALIGQLKRLAQQAQQSYPTNPRRQMEFMQQAVQGLMDAQKGPQRATDPTFQYNVPGAPQPEQNGSVKDRLQFQVIMDAARQLGYSEHDAFRIASGQKPPSEMELMNLARQLVTMEMPSGDLRATPDQRRQRYNEILTQLRSQQGAAPGAPAAAPGGTATPAAGMTGTGTQTDPYRASTQQQVDWFKQYAPAGSVIEVDGQLYTK